MVFQYFRRCFAKQPLLAGLAIAVISIALLLWAVRMALVLLIGGGLLALIWVFVLSPIFVKIGAMKKPQEPGPP